jgi:hypothetical protein
MLRCRYDVEPIRKQKAWVQRPRFLPAFTFQSNATGGQETTPTITPRSQHRPKVGAIATTGKDQMGTPHRR